MAETPLTDFKSWQAEAQAVINDVRTGVKEIIIAHNMPCNMSRIYLNITTFEEQTMCVELTARGFRVVGKVYDSKADGEEIYFETPYSLLSSKSPLFTDAFGSSLVNKLHRLQQERSSRDESPDSD